MGKDLPGWYYVGNSQKRYMDADGWTDQYTTIDDPYEKIDKPPARTRPLRANTEPTDRVSPSPATANKPPDAKKPRRRMSPLLIAFCVGLLALGVGGGLAKPDLMHGALSWITAQVGQVSNLVTPSTLPRERRLTPRLRRLRPRRLLRPAPRQLRTPRC
jgi:hypothetical protein